MRRDTVGPNMELLTSYASQQDHIQCEHSEKGHSWNWHVITCFLSNQQDQRVGTVRGHSWAWNRITHLLSSHKARLRVSTVSRDTAGPGMME